MKILHVTQGYSPAIGGTEWLIQRVSEELVAQFGDEVTVFTTNCLNGEAFYTPRLPELPTGCETINGVRVRRFPVRRRISQLVRPFQSISYHLGLPGNQRLRLLAGGPVIPELAKAVQNEPADVIAASSFPLMHMYSALKGARRSGRPIVFHGGLHPEDRWGFDRPSIYAAIQQADRYIANTGFEAEHVIQRGVSPDKISVVGVGVDREPFECAAAETAKASLGLDGCPLVGFVGQIGGHKGVDTLVRAMSLVWQVVPEARLLVAGGYTLFARHLERQIARLSGPEQEKILIRYNFTNEEKPGLFAAVDVFAYPSGFESFGITFLEAWACRKPVIGCRRGAVPWVVSSGRDGLLVDYQDEKMLAEAILMLLANRRWARSLGEAGHSKVVERYNWPEIARRFREVYEEAYKSNSERKAGVQIAG